jgi:hypothetical protein
VAVLNAQQLRRRRQVESVIRLMAPALDAVLFVGDRIARSAGGREDIGASAPRRALAAERRTRIGGPPA